VLHFGESVYSVR